MAVHSAPSLVLIISTPHFSPSHLQQLAADPNFKALAQPVLSRCEINAGLSDTADGYLYLRYDVLHAVLQEFWAQGQGQPPELEHREAQRGNWLIPSV